MGIPAWILAAAGISGPNLTSAGPAVGLVGERRVAKSSVIACHLPAAGPAGFDRVKGPLRAASRSRSNWCWILSLRGVLRADRDEGAGPGLLEEPLKHRHLVIYEAAGMSSEFANYLIRSLLSEGRLR